jgi:nucleoside-diphosphate-sugar epimerase
MKCLVTGGAGFIGSILVPALLIARHEVVVVDTFQRNDNSLAGCCAYGEFDVKRGDARDAKTIAPLIGWPDVVIPLAAIVGAPACDADKSAAETTNHGAVAMLCQMMRPNQKLIIPITNSGYGVGESGKECTEKTPLRPISFYGKTKVRAERAALERINAISLRLATVFGMAPRMRLDLLVNDFVYRAVTDHAVVLFESKFKRNYIHVRDVARAFLHAIENFDRMRGQAYNVGLSDANLSKFELCEKIREHVPNFVFLDAPIGEDQDKRNYVVSNAKIEAAGFKPKYTLDYGIAELVKGYQTIRDARAFRNA